MIAPISYTLYITLNSIIHTTEKLGNIIYFQTSLIVYRHSTLPPVRPSLSAIRGNLESTRSYYYKHIQFSSRSIFIYSPYPSFSHLNKWSLCGAAAASLKRISHAPPAPPPPPRGALQLIRHTIMTMRLIKNGYIRLRISN